MSSIRVDCPSLEFFTKQFEYTYSNYKISLPLPFPHPHGFMPYDVIDQIVKLIPSSCPKKIIDEYIHDAQCLLIYMGADIRWAWKGDVMSTVTYSHWNRYWSRFELFQQCSGHTIPIDIKVEWKNVQNDSNRFEFYVLFFDKNAYKATIKNAPFPSIKKCFIQEMESYLSSLVYTGFSKTENIITHAWYWKEMMTFLNENFLVMRNYNDVTPFDMDYLAKKMHYTPGDKVRKYRWRERE